MLTEQQKNDYKDCDDNICEECSMMSEHGDCVELYYKNEINILKEKLNKINNISVDLQETIYEPQEVFDRATKIYDLSLVEKGSEVNEDK